MHQTGNRDASTLWTGCGAIRRNAFNAVGGYRDGRDVRLEDIELGHRLQDAGHRIALDRSILCKHLKRFSLSSMIRTDFFLRALPWAKMILSRREFPNDLNVSLAQRVSVGLSLVGAAGLAGGLIFSPLFVLTALCIIFIVFLNRGFFKLLFQRHGSRFLLYGILLHIIYLLTSASGFLAALVSHYMFGDDQLSPPVPNEQGGALPPDS